MKNRIPLFVRDVEKMREHLTIPATGRVRIIFESGEGKLRIDLECVACEEMLDWDSEKNWWRCPVCQQETTESEMGELLTSCHDGLGHVLGAPEDVVGEDKGQKLEGIRGVGRWVQEVLGR